MEARLATAADAAAIARIYNEGIAERVATFETRPRTEEEAAGWIGGRYPVVVVEDEREVICFAATTAYSTRECYAGIAEFSVYVTRAARRRGAARMAVEYCARTAVKSGLTKLTGKIFAENKPSLELVKKLGFREVGVHVRHGRLDGEWRDVVVVEKLLQSLGDRFEIAEGRSSGTSGDRQQLPGGPAPLT